MATCSKDSDTKLSDLHIRTSLVVQWIGICLPMQGTQVRSFVLEDSTCHGANKPVGHNS